MTKGRNFRACVLVSFLATGVCAKHCHGEQCGDDNEDQSLLQIHNDENSMLQKSIDKSQNAYSMDSSSMVERPHGGPGKGKGGGGGTSKKPCFNCDYKNYACKWGGKCHNDGKLFSDPAWGKKWCASKNGAWCTKADKSLLQIHNDENSTLQSIDKSQNVYSMDSSSMVERPKGKGGGGGTSKKPCFNCDYKNYACKIGGSGGKCHNDGKLTTNPAWGKTWCASKKGAWCTKADRR